MTRAIDTRRLARELADLRRDATSGLTLTQPAEDDLTRLIVAFRGPIHTPYEHGTFRLAVTVTPGYPFKPPDIRFLTPVYHPNVSSQTGVICLDILKGEWTPALTIRSAVISIQSLLCSPVPEDPQDGVVASHFMEDREGWEEEARRWAREYASDGQDAEGGRAANWPTDGATYVPGSAAANRRRTEAAKDAEAANAMPSSGRTLHGRARPTIATSPTSARDGAAAAPCEQDALPPGVDPIAFMRLRDMGFPRTSIVQAMLRWGGDEAGALEELLGGGGM